MRRLPADPLDEEEGAGVPAWAWQLAYLNRQLTQVGCALAPLTSSRFGFEAVGSWKTVAPVLAKKGQPAAVDQLSEDDVEDGLVAEHLGFLKRRNICLLYIVSGDGGTLRLYPAGARDGENHAISHDIPLRSSLLILFRHSHMSFEYSPLGRDSLALQSWMMAAAEVPEIDKIDATALRKDEIYEVEGTKKDSRVRFPTVPALVHVYAIFFRYQ
jgi:hypothetical protein